MNTSKKILLAECDAFLINVYANELRKSGYSTSVAIDGEVVMSRIKNITPDLLILDASLPKNGGFSVLKMLREDMGMKDLKVIMISNSNRQEDANKFFQLGIEKHFTKIESTAEEIVEEIKRILS